MAYATIEDVTNILPEGEEVPADAEDRLQTGLEEATDLVVAFLEREYTQPDEDQDGVPDDVPPAVRRVVARVAMRGFLDEPTNPGAQAEVELMGPFSHTINWAKEAQARSFFLTDGEKLRLEPYKAGYTGQAGHFPMSGAGGDWTVPGYAAPHAESWYA